MGGGVRKGPILTQPSASLNPDINNLLGSKIHNRLATKVTPVLDDIKVTVAGKHGGTNDDKWRQLRGPPL